MAKMLGFPTSMPEDYNMRRWREMVNGPVFDSLRGTLDTSGSDIERHIEKVWFPWLDWDPQHAKLTSTEPTRLDEFVEDAKVARWQRAWLVAFLEATLLLRRHLHTARSVRTQIRVGTVAQELHRKFGMSGTSPFPDITAIACFSLAFWQDLVSQLLLGVQDTLSPSRECAFPLVFERPTSDIRGLVGKFAAETVTASAMAEDMAVYPDPAQILCRPMDASFAGIFVNVTMDAPALIRRHSRSDPGTKYAHVRVRITHHDYERTKLRENCLLNGPSGGAALLIAVVAACLGHRVRREVIVSAQLRTHSDAISSNAHGVYLVGSLDEKLTLIANLASHMPERSLRPEFLTAEIENAEVERQLNNRSLDNNIRFSNASVTQSDAYEAARSRLYLDKSVQLPDPLREDYPYLEERLIDLRAYVVGTQAAPGKNLVVYEGRPAPCLRMLATLGEEIEASRLPAKSQEYWIYLSCTLFASPDLAPSDAKWADLLWQRLQSSESILTGKADEVHESQTPLERLQRLMTHLTEHPYTYRLILGDVDRLLDNQGQLRAHGLQEFLIAWSDKKSPPVKFVLLTERPWLGAPKSHEISILKLPEMFESGKISAAQRREMQARQQQQIECFLALVHPFPAPLAMLKQVPEFSEIFLPPLINAELVVTYTPNEDEVRYSSALDEEDRERLFEETGSAQVNRLHGIAAQYHKDYLDNIIQDENADLERKSSYTRWYGLEDAAFLDHALHLIRHRQGERVSVSASTLLLSDWALLYFDSLYWWGEYVVWGPNDTLAAITNDWLDEASPDNRDSRDTRDFKAALLQFHQNFPRLGADNRRDLQDSLQLARDALLKLRTVLHCQSLEEARSQGEKKTDQTRLRLFIMTSNYLADMQHLLGNRDACELYSEAIQALYALNGLDFDGYDWMGYWLLVDSAVAHLENGNLEEVRECCRQYLQYAMEMDDDSDDAEETKEDATSSLSLDTPDDEVMARFAYVVGDWCLLQEDKATQELAWKAYLLSLAYLVKYQISAETQPDEYTVTLFQNETRRLAQRFVTKFAQGNANAVEGAALVYRFWHEGDNSEEGRQNLEEAEIKALLMTNDVRRVGEALLPPVPLTYDAKLPAQNRAYRDLVIRRLAHAANDGMQILTDLAECMMGQTCELPKTLRLDYVGDME